MLRLFSSNLDLVIHFRSFWIVHFYLSLFHIVRLILVQASFLNFVHISIISFSFFFSSIFFMFGLKFAVRIHFEIKFKNVFNFTSGDSCWHLIRLKSSFQKRSFECKGRHQKLTFPELLIMNFKRSNKDERVLFLKKEKTKERKRKRSSVD